MCRAKTLFVCVFASLVMAVGGQSASAAKPTADISLRFLKGRTFEVRLQTDTEKQMRGKTRSDSITLVTQRHISQGGRWGKDPIQWNEKITRLMVSDRRFSFDSQRDTAVTQDTAPFLLLLGVSYDAKLTASRDVTILNLKRDPSILRKAGYDEDLVKMMLASTSAQAFATELRQGLAVIPNRRMTVGQRFKHRVAAAFGPQASGVKVTFHFKLLKVVGDYAELSFTAKGPRQVTVGGARLKAMKGAGTLRFNHAQGFVERMNTTVNMTFAVGRQKVKWEVKMALSQRLLPAPTSTPTSTPTSKSTK